MAWFFAGLGSLFVGLIVWVVFSVLLAVSERGSGGDYPFITTMRTLGFILMVGGPILFWLLAPVISGVRAVLGRLTGGR